MKHYAVTVSRTGSAVVIAEDAAEAIDKANCLKTDEIRWDDDWYADDAHEVFDQAPYETYLMTYVWDGSPIVKKAKMDEIVDDICMSDMSGAHSFKVFGIKHTEMGVNLEPLQVHRVMDLKQGKLYCTRVYLSDKDGLIVDEATFQRMAAMK